jgi:phosphoglycolate phosphatase
MPRYPHVLFDLDGTLIDSAPAILASFKDAFEAVGCTPVRPIDVTLIGPPLPETLALIAGNRDAGLIEALAAAFKASYDTTGYRQTAAYAGITDMLTTLSAQGCSLSIATNKRIHPTELILQHLGWRDLFKAVYALDLFEPRLPHKAAMIGRLMAEHGISAQHAVYIGDRLEDGEAAEANALPFIAATWGYGSLSAAEMKPHWHAAGSPAALAEWVLGRA